MAILPTYKGTKMLELIDIEKEVSEELLELHRLAAIDLKLAKIDELNLRNQITDILLEGRDTGTHNFILHDMKVKAVKAVSHAFDQEMIHEFIDNGEVTDEEMELIRTKYELKVGDYKKALFETDILDQAIIVKPSQPTLTVSLGE